VSTVRLPSLGYTKTPLEAIYVTLEPCYDGTMYCTLVPLTLQLLDKSHTIPIQFGSTFDGQTTLTVNTSEFHIWLLIARLLLFVTHTLFDLVCPGDCVSVKLHSCEPCPCILFNFTEP